MLLLKIFAMYFNSFRLVFNLPTAFITILLVLYNAIAHRNYQSSSAVYVKHYPDKVVIENPGGFVSGVTTNNIITYPSSLRNKLIFETLQRLKYVQRTGQGVDIIYREMLSSGKPYP